MSDISKTTKLPHDEPRQIVCTGEAGSGVWNCAFGTWEVDDFGIDSDEPVGEGERLFVNRRLFDAALTRIAELEAAQSVEVKPLIWSKFEHSPEAGQEYVSLTLVGKYFIGFGMTKGKRYVEYNGVALTDENGVIWFDYLNDAKAAAQSDYERRIKSALQPTPVTVQQAATIILNDTQSMNEGAAVLSQYLADSGTACAHGLTCVLRALSQDGEAK